MSQRPPEGVFCDSLNSSVVGDLYLKIVKVYFKSLVGQVTHLDTTVDMVFFGTST